MLLQLVELGLTEEQMADVLGELGLQDTLSYNPETQKPVFTMTGIQHVAFVYALVAARECGFEHVLTRPELVHSASRPPVEEEEEILG